MFYFFFNIYKLVIFFWKINIITPAHIFFNFNTLNAEQFWSNKVDGPTSNEEAIKLLDGKKLDPIEGLWFTDGLGTLLIFKDKDTLQSLKNNFDQNQIIYALDFKKVEDIYCVCSHGWQEETNIDIFFSKNLPKIFCFSSFSKCSI